MSSQPLKNKLKQYASDLISLYGRNNKLPATIIGAEYSKFKKVDKSGRVPNPISKYLKIELEKIGQLGSVGHKYRIGCCCEARSSNQILLELESLSKPVAPLKHIRFTDAIRPRTNQVINRCLNCQTVFG